MSVRRLIADIDTSTVNVTEFCAAHKISRSRFYRIRSEVAEHGIEPRSRAPKSSPHQTPAVVEEAIVRIRKQLDDDALDAGAATIQWHLQQDQTITTTPSMSTIWRILKARGFITPEPKKRPKTAIRFEADRANEVWQIDGTNSTLADGSIVKIINVIDDGSRFVPSSRAHSGETIEGALDAVLAGASQVGLPERLLSDNGIAFKSLEESMAEVGVGIGHSRPYHPQTCGKVERFHQTQQKWLAKRPAANDLTELQHLLDEFRQVYNHERPHSAIGKTTPAKRFDAMSKSGPADRPLDIENRQMVRATTVNPDGQVFVGGYKIGIGSTHAGQRAWVVITGQTATVFVNGSHIETFALKPGPNQPRLRPRRQR